jgi:DNA-binding response OmpR family regulator
VRWQEIPRSLQIKYLHAAAITAAQLARLAGQLRQDAAGMAVLKLMLRRFQGLAAWAGLHGQAGISVAAQLGEYDCATLAGAGLLPETAQLEQIAALVHVLRQEIHRQRTTAGASDEILWGPAAAAPAPVPLPAAPAPRSLAGSARLPAPARGSALAMAAHCAAVRPAAAGAGLPPPEPLALAAPSRPARRVLAVGLRNVEWNVAEGLLARQGFALQAVETCREAGRVFAAGLPDAVIAAADLPDGTGTLLAQYLRVLDLGDDPAVILIGEAGGVAAGGAPADAGSAVPGGASDNAGGAAPGGASADAGSAAAGAAPGDPCRAEAEGGREVDAWFAAPVDWVSLAQGLAALVARRQSAPVLLYLEGYEDAGALRALLRAAGYRVRRCREPRRLAGDALAFSPDLVLMDAPLAGETAGELVRRLRGERRFAALPVLVLEAADGAEPPSRVSPGGAEHLAKPVDPRALLATIAARIERSRALDQLFSPAAAAPPRPAAVSKRPRAASPAACLPPAAG